MILPSEVELFRAERAEMLQTHDAMMRAQAAKLERERLLFGKVTTAPHHGLPGPKELGPVVFWLVMCSALLALPMLLVMLLVYFACAVVCWPFVRVFEAVALMRARKGPVF